MLLGNIIAFIASIIMVLSGFLKTKKKILFAECIEIVLFITGDIIVGAISAAIINFLSLVRDIILYNNKMNLFAKIFLIVSSTILIILFNNLSFIGLLPLFAMYIYVLCMDKANIKKFKFWMIIVMILWSIHDISIKLYAAFFFDILTTIAYTITLLMPNKRKHKKLDVGL